ncbi:hypothetical protein [Fluviispira vulneris]|uniref:hypothetical protein n=1 Tax=Fluviispira vulneris TaxID=2763012 RepID=UPI001646F7B8|nr:hypothetical protein [Fluviispira vulneris]
MSALKLFNISYKYIDDQFDSNVIIYAKSELDAKKVFYELIDLGYFFDDSIIYSVINKEMQ